MSKDVDSGVVACHCNHLTNFGVLVVGFVELFVQCAKPRNVCTCSCSKPSPPHTIQLLCSVTYNICYPAPVVSACTCNTYS